MKKAFEADLATEVSDCTRSDSPDSRRTSRKSAVRVGQAPLGATRTARARAAQVLRKLRLDLRSACLWRVSPSRYKRDGCASFKSVKRFIYEVTESWKIALAQMQANKTRSMLTALGVIIGIVAVT